MRTKSILCTAFLVGALATTQDADAISQWRPREYPSPDHYARAVENVLAGNAPGLYGSHIQYTRDRENAVGM